MKSLNHFITYVAFTILSAQSLHATDFTFNVTAGDWSVAANWSPVGVPGAGDDVMIPSSVILDIPVTINNCTISGGLIQGPNTLTINGNLIMNSGEFSNSGSIIVGSDFTWNLGTINAGGAMTVSGTTNITNAGGRNLSRILNLNGNCNWSEGNIWLFTGGKFNVGTGSTLSVNNSTNVGFSYQSLSNSQGEINLSGSFIKQGAGIFFINRHSINNTGSISLQGGTLQFWNKGTIDGAITSNPGTVLDFDGNPEDVSSNANQFTQTTGSITCNGKIIKRLVGIFLNGNSNALGEVEIVDKGGLTINTPNASMSSLYMNAGAVAGNCNLTVSGNVSLNLTPNYSVSDIANQGTFNVGGNLTWTGGGFGASPGNATVAGLATISEEYDKALNRNLVLNGGCTWLAGNIVTVPNATMEIANTTTLSINNSTLTQFYGGGILLLNGSLNKDGIGTCWIANITQNGIITIIQGILNLGSGFSTNQINTQSGTTLEISGSLIQSTNGTINCANALFKVTGGSPVFNSNTNTFNEGIMSGGASTFNATNTTFSTLSLAATLQGPTNLTVTGNFAFTNGNLINTGTIHVGGSFTWAGGNNGNAPTNGAMSVTGASTITSNGLNKNLYRNFNLNGGGTWDDGGYSNTSASLGMGGNNIRFYIPSGQTLTVNMGSNNFGLTTSTSGGYIDVAGMFVKTGAVTFTCAKDLVNSGTLSINAGILDLTAAFNNTGFIKGNGTIDLGSSVTNTGTFAPGLSPGTLTHTGLAYTNSTLDFEIQESGGTVSKDLLNVTGNMTLGGTLNIQYLGGTVPPGTYDIAVCTGTCTGTFASINYPSNCNGNCSVTYTSNKAQLVLGASLPLELLEFAASAKNDDVNLKWHTFNETNVRDFDIQRSTDASTWEYVGIKTANNQKTENQYRFTDYGAAQASPGEQKLYYRLKMNDLDGSFDYSPIVYAFLEDRNGLRVWPNPTTSDLIMHYTANSETEQLLTVYGSDGRVVLSQRMQVQKGDNSWPIATDGWPSGMYRISLGGEVLELVKR